NLIKNWAKLFLKLFTKYSRSQLKLPKLHNWCYYIITTIKEYGPINGFTAETYETLHKDYVKKPCRASNKRDATGQIIQV
ncbi:6980_t:CDS:1, partial [Gigaspora rosea]